MLHLGFPIARRFSFLCLESRNLEPIPWGPQGIESTNDPPLVINMTHGMLLSIYPAHSDVKLRFPIRNYMDKAIQQGLEVLIFADFIYPAYSYLKLRFSFINCKDKARPCSKTCSIP